MFKYLRSSLARKKARRFFREYPCVINTFHLEKEGKVEFANWENPLVRSFTLSGDEMDFWQKFISKGNFVIDIGANIGDTTVPMALAAGKDGLTLGFDPNPHVFRILQINADLNKNKTNIIPLPYAITAEDCELHYYSSDASFANGGISEDKISHHGRFKLNKKIRGINLENYLTKKYAGWLPNLSLIKIDAEGYDIDILKSIRNIIRNTRPVLVGEFFQKYDYNQRLDLFRVVENMGYHLFYFYDFSDTRKIFRITEENLNRPEIFNFYALPD